MAHRMGPKEIAAREMREARYASKHQSVKDRAKIAKRAMESATSAKAKPAKQKP